MPAHNALFVQAHNKWLVHLHLIITCVQLDTLPSILTLHPKPIRDNITPHTPRTSTEGRQRGIVTPNPDMIDFVKHGLQVVGNYRAEPI